MNTTQQPTHSDSSETLLFSKKDLIFVAIAVFIAGWIVKIPRLIHQEEDLFFARNIGFIVFPTLLFYFTWKKKTNFKTLIIPTIIMLAAAIFINSLPQDEKSDTLILSCIHLPILIW